MVAAAAVGGGGRCCVLRGPVQFRNINRLGDPVSLSCALTPVHWMCLKQSIIVRQASPMRLGVLESSLAVSSYPFVTLTIFGEAIMRKA